MKNIHTFPHSDELIKALADKICVIAGEAIELQNRFNFVLSGGSSPRRLYELLASESYRNKINWDKTRFFFGDERFVPADDKERNSLMVQESLFEPLQIPESHIFKVDTTGSPEEAAKNYAKTISDQFEKKPIVFDFILLGLGDDAHTASLFPHTPVIQESEATVRSVFIEKLATYRITMTAPLINQAKQIAFLVYGKGKAMAVKQVIAGKTGSSADFPARLIDREKAEWYLDAEAASQLQQN